MEVHTLLKQTQSVLSFCRNQKHFRTCRKAKAMLLKVTFNLLLLSVVCMFSSCSNISDEEVRNYRIIDASFERSNEQIQSSIRQIFRAFEDKMSDPATQEKGTYWHNKAESIRILINKTEKYIADLKVQLKSANEKSKSSVRKVFSKEKTSDLVSVLSNCRAQLLAVYPDFIETFQHLLPIGLDSSLLSFEGLTTIATITRLSQIESDLNVSENMLLTYCFRRVPSGEDGYFVFSILSFGYNSVYYPGEKAEINAGIGAFTSKAFPEVKVNGKKAERTPEGCYQYRFNVSKKPGNYKAFVSVKYVDPNTGQPASVKKTIQYKVIPKCPQ
jgi:hypothetical protein